MILDTRPIVEGLPFSAAIVSLFENIFDQQAVLESQLAVMVLPCQENGAVRKLDRIWRVISQQTPEQQISNADAHDDQLHLIVLRRYHQSISSRLV